LLERSGGTPSPAPTTTGSRPVGGGVPETRGGPAAEAEQVLSPEGAR
jgi:hypothetical protein